MLTASPLTLILERHTHVHTPANPSADQQQQQQQHPSSLMTPSDPAVSNAPASEQQQEASAPLPSPPPSTLLSDFLNFVHEQSHDDPPVLTLHLCLRAVNSDFLPCLANTAGSPVASPRQSFSLASKEVVLLTPVAPGSPAEQLNSIVVSFLPVEFYRAVPDIRVPYLSVPPPPEGTSLSLSPKGA